MREQLNTRSMIFTIWGDYIRHYGNEIWVGSLIQLLEAFGHNAPSVRAAISRMNKQGWVAARKAGNKSFYSLTDRGRKRMDEAADRIFKLHNDEWDGLWRMFIYTIPENKRQIRDELRKELVWNGFGQFSQSFWITPNNLESQVEDIIDKYQIEEFVNVFTAENKGPTENRSLVRKCWDMEEINARYDEFIKFYSEKFVLNKNNIEKSAISDKDCFVERAKLVHEYRKFLFIDPGLPEELQPEKWLGEIAASLFRDYYRILAEPASRFFEGVYLSDHEDRGPDQAYDMLDHPLIIDQERS